MNRSGASIKQAITFYKAEPTTDLLVIVDDIHLPCGTFRLRSAGTDGGHNGLLDIVNHFGDCEWSRLRIGVDEPGLIPQVDYVLGRFTPEQLEQVKPAIEGGSARSNHLIESGIDEAMNKCNESGNQKVGINSMTNERTALYEGMFLFPQSATANLQNAVGHLKGHPRQMRSIHNQLQ